MIWYAIVSSVVVFQESLVMSIMRLVQRSAHHSYVTMLYFNYIVRAKISTCRTSNNLSFCWFIFCWKKKKTFSLIIKCEDTEKHNVRILLWLSLSKVLLCYNLNGVCLFGTGSSDLSPHSLTILSGFLAVISVNIVIAFYIYMAMKEPSNQHEPDPAFLAAAKASVIQSGESADDSSKSVQSSKKQEWYEIQLLCILTCFVARYLSFFFFIILTKYHSSKACENSILFIYLLKKLIKILAHLLYWYINGLRGINIFVFYSVTAALLFVQ